MGNIWELLPPGWLDWLVVMGYVGFMLVIVWRVLRSGERE